MLLSLAAFVICVAPTRDPFTDLENGTRAADAGAYAIADILLTRALNDNPGFDRVTLGTSCQFQFRQAVPVSASARIDLVSGHRLRLALDGVLLMAETLVLGPGQQVHVNMPELKWHYGYYAALGLMGLSMLLLYRMFKKRDYF